ncbi:MAG TPA: PAS domain-containing protein [Chitinophagaceae bacterium]|nr:PAS domain-containing protein [Chitinophagaceae bacterium]
MSSATITELAWKSLQVANHTDAMLGYWDKNLICRYANPAYQRWFGKRPEEMIDKISIRELLGNALYEKNLPYILGALNGQQQIFERDIVLPSGETRKTIASYYPNIQNGITEGFFVHVADVTMLQPSLPVIGQQHPAAEQQPLTVQEPEILQVAETIREAVFARFPGIAVLARQHFLSPTKLKTSFKEIFNCTPFVFYRNLQMELVEKFLADNIYTEQQLTRLFNFSSRRNFKRCYQQYQQRKAAIAAEAGKNGLL